LILSSNHAVFIVKLFESGTLIYGVDWLLLLAIRLKAIPDFFNVLLDFGIRASVLIVGSVDVLDNLLLLLGRDISFFFLSNDRRLVCSYLVDFRLCFYC
jgi:hypothetical protein